MANVTEASKIFSALSGKFARTKVELGKQIYDIVVLLPFGKYIIGGVSVEVVKMECGMSEWANSARRNDYTGYGYGVVVDGDTLAFEDFEPHSDNTPHNVYNASIRTYWRMANGDYRDGRVYRLATMAHLRAISKGLAQFMSDRATQIERS